MTHALAIDTTSDYLSLGVMRNDQPASSHYVLCGTRIARTILPEIERLLKQAELTPQALDVVILNRGPGSFTGTRIGMSVGLTLGRVLGKPVVGVDSLKVLAAQVDPNLSGPFHVLLNCAREEVYYASYQWQANRLIVVSEIRLTSLALAAQDAGRTPCLLRRFEPAQKGHDALIGTLVPAPLRYPQPDALRLLEVGLAQFAEYEGRPFEAPTPLYLKSEAFRTWQPTAGVQA